MATWEDVETADPAFAARVRALFDAHKHKTIATLRADGSPRISGIEAEFEDGQLARGTRVIDSAPPNQASDRRSTSRRANFWTLPVAVRGRSATSRISSGHF